MIISTKAIDLKPVSNDSFKWIQWHLSIDRSMYSKMNNCMLFKEKFNTYVISHWTKNLQSQPWIKHQVWVCLWGRIVDDTGMYHLIIRKTVRRVTFAPCNFCLSTFVLPFEFQLAILTCIEEKNLTPELFTQSKLKFM